MSNDIHQLVFQLINVDQRENALLELSKKREAFPELAPILWHSYGTIAALLQEIISIYPMLSPPTLSPQASNRVCNALALLQCVASHPETKLKLLNAHIPLYLYPFLNTISRHRPFEYLRLTSLGVIGAFVKVDDTEVVNFLLQTEIIPLCLRIMESGSELSKTVATFIVQKILLDDNGLAYVCATAERFYAVSAVLSGMVAKLLEVPSVRLLKHIVRCYLRLSEHARARDALRQCLPESLWDQSFAKALQGEETVQRWLAALLRNISPGGGGDAAAAGAKPQGTTGANPASGSGPGAGFENFGGAGAAGVVPGDMSMFSTSGSGGAPGASLGLGMGMASSASVDSGLSDICNWVPCIEARKAGKPFEQNCPKCDPKPLGSLAELKEALSMEREKMARATNQQATKTASDRIELLERNIRMIETALINDN